MEHFDSMNSESIVVRFTCDSCGEYVTSEDIAVPLPDYSAESAGDSFTEDGDMAFCEKCGKGFDITVMSGFDGGYVYVSHLPDECNIEIIEKPQRYYDDIDYFEAILDNTEFYSTFKQEMINLRELNNASFSKIGLEKTFRQQIYVGAVTSLETYLSDAFINTVLSDEQYLRKFIKTFESFKKEKFSLNEVFERYDTITEKAKKSMSDVIYHKIPTVSNMYRDALGVKFPSFGNIVKAVLIRHDLVHRNGKTKDGEPVEITQEVAFELLATIEKFVEEIDNQLNEYTETEHPF